MSFFHVAGIALEQHWWQAEVQKYMRYIKQLDSLRAIAVILVIISHWIPKLNVYPLGAIGVDVFFVLSGFLISGILLENKKLHNVHNIPNGEIVKNFIIRRTLRIFPVYYLIVIVHYLVADHTGTTVKENLVYYLTYTSNILFFTTGHLDGIASHFWSLAVEEQFYIFWPWVILLVKEKHLAKVIVSFIVIGILFPIIVPNSGSLAPACFSAFAIGAMLAYIKHEDLPITKWHSRLLNYASIFSFVLLILYPFWNNIYIPVRLLVSVLTFRLIQYCLYENDKGILNFVLQNRILIFIGKISYGIYLYHTIVPWFWRVSYEKLLSLGWDIHRAYVFVPSSLHNDVDVVAKFLLLILISWLSWILIESPINRMKRNFEYQKT